MASVDQKLLKATKFPPEFSRKVDMQKVNIEVMKKWIARRISGILGTEDDVVIELCFNLLEGARYPDIKVLQIQLTGFLEKDTAAFCKELWSLCLSAQSNAQGVPKELLEAKKQELIQEKIEAQRSAEADMRRKENDLRREREIESIRDRERSSRGRGRGGFRGGRDYDGDRRTRDSRSPPRFRREREGYRAAPRREADTYVPSAGGRRREGSRSRRSPSYERSRSRSPPRKQRRRRSPSSSRSASRSPSERPRQRRRRSSSGHSRRDKSATPLERSRSRSPRRHRPGKRDRSVSTRSSTPPPRRRRSPSTPHGGSRSPSPRRDRGGRPYRSRRRSPSSDRSGPRDRSANVRKARDRSESLPRRRSARSPSRSASPPRKRRRSMERYQPKARRRSASSSPEPPPRRRNTSSVDSAEPARGERGERSDDERSGEHDGSEDLRPDSQRVAVPQQRRANVNELREKLLKQKLMARRRPSDAAKVD